MRRGRNRSCLFRGQMTQVEFRFHAADTHGARFPSIWDAYSTNMRTSMYAWLEYPRCFLPDVVRSACLLRFQTSGTARTPFQRRMHRIIRMYFLSAQSDRIRLEFLGFLIRPAPFLRSRRNATSAALFFHSNVRQPRRAMYLGVSLEEVTKIAQVAEMINMRSWCQFFLEDLV